MLKEITNTLYMYKHTDTMKFMLQEGSIGILGLGKCWRLSLVENGNSTFIACFVTRSDGNHCEIGTVDNTLWTLSNLLKRADEIISAFI